MDLKRMFDLHRKTLDMVSYCDDVGCENPFKDRAGKCFGRLSKKGLWRKLYREVSKSVT
jgi:hypothetical protein